MTGKLYIDGKDAFTQYGVFVCGGGYGGVVGYPPLKSVDSVDWPEEDGIDVDLSNPVLGTKEFPVHFACTDNERIGDFIALLSDGAYHVFDFAEIGFKMNLRMISQPSKQSLRNLEKFSLQFADDKPLDGYEYAAPVGYSKVWRRGYEIDGRDLSQYGVWVLEGAHDELLKSPAVKPNLLTTNNHTPGSYYDGEQVFFKHKEVNLPLLARAASPADFWRNYNALLYDLVRPGERALYYEVTGEEYPCHYKSSDVREFALLPEGGVWCAFSLTLVFTSFRVGEMNYLLAAERGELVVTEDGGYYIDLEYGD